MDLEALHSRYCELTGRQQSFLCCARLWFDWAKMGFTKENLELVLAYVLEQNKTHDWQFSLRPGRLLEPEHFDGLLGDATDWDRQRRRIPKKTPKEEILEQWRGSRPEGGKGTKARVALTVLKDVIRNGISDRQT